MNEKDSAARLEEYARYLTLERGLSPRTVSAYRSDVGAFYAWAAEHKLAAAKATRSDLDDFLWAQRERSLKPTSLFRSQNRPDHGERGERGALLGREFPVALEKSRIHILRSMRDEVHSRHE